ncbi:MAG: hypothetical protein HQK96_11835 [Nitrospirae bacterium]|nr:hypothetical protein [Nitrospirota bacterium]
MEITLAGAEHKQTAMEITKQNAILCPIRVIVEILFMIHSSASFCRQSTALPLPLLFIFDSALKMLYPE